MLIAFLSHARLSRAFLLLEVSVVMDRIDRAEKNCMRKNLEDILKMQREIETKIKAYHQEAAAEEYRQFWVDFGSKNRQTIKNLTSYMARKANR